MSDLSKFGSLGFVTKLNFKTSEKRAHQYSPVENLYVYPNIRVSKYQARPDISLGRLPLHQSNGLASGQEVSSILYWEVCSPWD